MRHQSFYQPGGMLYEAVKRRDEQAASVLIWCFVCKDWISAHRGIDYCPRCGNDEIEHDDD